MNRLWLGVLVGSLGAWAAVQTVPENDIAYAVVTIGIATFVAGLVAARRGAVAGFAALVFGWSAWVITRLIDAWTSGALGATFPNCDPCGLVGYLGRFAIVTAVVIPIFGLLGSVSGWFGSFALRVVGDRLRARPQTHRP